MATRFLYLSDGEMGYYDGAKAVTLHSERMAKYIQTLHDIAEHNAWKYEGEGAKFQGRVNPYANVEHQANRCRVTALLPFDGRVLYALSTPDMGGLYLRSLEPVDKAEGSWLSDRQFRVSDLHCRGNQVALSLACPNMETHIALMEADSARYRVITQGDTEDEAPFLSSDGVTLYYASAGYARDEQGIPIARGPSALLRLNLHTGSLEEVCAEPAFDCLRPKEGPDGALYFIRRPYKQETPRAGVVDRVKNVGAIFKGMGKLLSYIGNPERAKKQMQVAGQPKADAQKRLLEGVMLDVTPANPAQEDDTAGFVPEEWVLLRRDADGTLTEIQRGVADYDFDGEAILYTNGRRVIRLEDGRKTVLHRGLFIPRIHVLKEAAC